MQRLAALLGLLVVLMTGPALAGEAEIAAIRAVLAPGPVDAGLFTAEFLKAVPPDKLQAATEPLKTLIGPVVAVEARGGQTYAVETATHEMITDIVLDAGGKIAGLLFHAPVQKTASLADLLTQMAAAAPQSAYVVLKDGKPIAASNADMALAVGSAFKLGVLKALKDEIDSGMRQWSDVVSLKAEDMSLPSGFLQTWPVGAPLTLHTLATLMISISDNTAADTLLKLVGRDKVETALGIAPAPTTRELFILKANHELLSRYVAADAEGARLVLAEADALPLPDVSQILTPFTPGAEWQVSPQRLCALMGEVAGLDVTQVNPGVVPKSDWASVSFKGGSEVGVLSLVTEAKAKDGATYCVAAIWNGPQALDESKAEAAYAGVMGKLARGG
jgi:sulfur carrier protein ThiS